MNNTLIKPLLTEKATIHAEKNVHMFTVGARMNKHQVAKRVETIFNVEVDTVKTIIRKGKEKRVGKKQKLKTLPDRKFAYVTLKKGTISVMPQA